MKVAIAGIGCVGLSNAMLLAQYNEVVAIDVAAEKTAMLNVRQSTIDVEIQEFLGSRALKWIATPRAITSLPPP